MPDPARQAAERARAVVLVLLGALMLAAALAVVRGATSAVALTLLGAFLLVPLALPVPGILRRNRRAYAWATLCLTPHFVYALTELVANPALRTLAVAMLVLSVAVMAALVAYLRMTRG